MAKFNATTLIVVVQLALVINSVTGLPIETPSINERDMELEPRSPLGGFGLARGAFGLASKGFGLARKYLPKTGRYLQNKWHNGGKQAVETGAKDAAFQLLDGGGGMQGYGGMQSFDGMQGYKRDLGYTFGDGALGNRGLEERDWSDLEAREYLDMNELD